MEYWKHFMHHIDKHNSKAQSTMLTSLKKQKKKTKANILIEFDGVMLQSEHIISKHNDFVIAPKKKLTR